MKKHAVPIIAAILLLLPLLYVGSYFALLRPPQILLVPAHPETQIHHYAQYRLGGKVAEQFFWPLEQIDRKVRPESWGDVYDEADSLNRQRTGNWH